MDVSPEQIWSVATAMIPFLEHDDANRALMGSNMQRQAVPLLRTDAPLVGTGMEPAPRWTPATSSSTKNAGTVAYVDAIEDHRRDLQAAPTSTRCRSSPAPTRARSSTTSRSSRPGTRSRPGTVLADGSSTSQGEMALGKNLLVAFMSWEGYNFEDAIILSRRLVKDDELTSIHIE